MALNEEYERSERSGSARLCSQMGQSQKKVKLVTVADLSYKTYYLREVLGQGSSSVVYLATRRRTKKSKKSADLEVALKVVDVSSENQVMAEYSILTILNHPRFPQVIGCRWSSSLRTWYIGLTLAKGGDLFSWIEEKLPSEEQLAPIMYQLIQAISFLHDSGFMHRDLKLENILFKDEARTEILICDWGLASPHSLFQIVSLDCGTLHYCPPEILENQPYGPAVDIWSIGIILYSLRTGYFPFPGDTPSEKLAHTCKPILFPDSISVELKSLISSLLRPNPSLRISLSSALSHPWFSKHISPSQLCALDKAAIPSSECTFSSPVSNNSFSFQSSLGSTSLDSSSTLSVDARYLRQRYSLSCSTSSSNPHIQYR